MKLRLLFLASVLLVAPGLRAADATPSTPPPDSIPPRVVAPNDESSYRRFTLDNGLKVILLSDPKLNKSAAALAVGAGSFNDPRNRQGLAHFLEHMLFLGTEKYPEASDYGTYLKSNGGYENAYTAGDHTNFHFEVRHEALEGALDRFSQFFIAPLFAPKYAEREMNAVNSEHQKNVENDAWREYELGTLFYRPGHPANHFSTGDRETLTGTSHEELLAFYQAHYSSNRMTLAITGKASLDQLEQWTRKYFTAVPNRHLEPTPLPADYLPPKPALRLARMEPLKDLRQINLEFPLPPTLPYYASKPGALLGFIIGHEGTGSLLSQLKAEGLATGLSAGSESAAREFGSFNVNITLTPAGLQHYSRVLELFFSAVNQLQAAGYPSYLFRERQALARLDETFRDKGEGTTLAVWLANQLRDYPMEIAEREPYLWLHEDPVAYQQVLGQLRPDNLLVTLVAKGVKTDQVEHFYGTHYSYAEDAGPAYTALLHPPTVAAITLPKANPYVPSTAVVRPIQPVQLINEPAASLYYAQDTEFLRPQVAEIFRFRLPRSAASLEHAVLLRFYEACVKESLNENVYPAREAGLDFSFTASLEGIQFVVQGYDSSAPRLVDTVAASLVDFSLSEERFNAVKDRLLREFANFPRADAWQILRESQRAVVREFYFRPDDQLAAAQHVTLASVRAFAHQLYRKGKLEALVHGNVTADDAITATRRLSQAFGTQPVADADLLRRRLLVQAAGEPVRSSEKLAVNNSAFRQDYVLGNDSPEMRAATLVLGNFIAEPFYGELRTHQQLGYIVSASAAQDEHTSLAYFIVQSGEHPADEVEGRAEAFIAQLPDLLGKLSDAEWQTLVGAASDKLKEKDKTIAERAGRLFVLAYDRSADWSENEATLAALGRLTKERTREILAAAVSPATARSRTYLGFARQHEPATPPKVTFTDRTAWKQTRKYE